LVVFIPTAIFLSDQVLATGNLRDRLVAANLAAQILETARSESFATLQQGADGPPTSTTQTVGSITYTLTTIKRWQTATVDASGCDSTGNGASNLASSALLLVEGTVTWRSMSGTPPVRADTTIAQPWTSGAPTTGSFELAVTDAGGAPSGNVPVVVTDANNNKATYLTDSNGCLFLANEAAGTYTLQLNQTGWIDAQENPAPSEPISVTAGAFATATPMNYDNGATISLSFSGATPPINLPVTVANTSLIPSGTHALTGGAPSTAPLYPYRNGYAVWPGGCPDSNPGVQNNNTAQALYPSAPAAPVVTPGPGQSAMVTLPLSTLNVVVQDAASQPVANSKVGIVAATDPNTASCSDTTLYTLSGTTSATGAITAGLPLGSFQVYALDANGNPIGSPAAVSMQPGSTTAVTVTR
jgi:hypothetical protein